MSNVNLPRPDQSDLAEASSIQKYLEKLLTEIENNMRTIDGDNLTESYKKKIEKED